MFQVTINDIVFTIEHQKLILQTVIDNGFSVGHSCRSGRCNECVARVQNNDTVNEILSCQYIPEPGDQFIFEKFELRIEPIAEIFSNRSTTTNLPTLPNLNNTSNCFFTILNISPPKVASQRPASWQEAGLCGAAF